MFPVEVHKFQAQKHVFSVRKHKFSAQKHKIELRKKSGIITRGSHSHKVWIAKNEDV